MKFENLNLAAEDKWKLLQKNYFNWEILLNPPDKQCVTSYGSEFKRVEDLEKQLGKHPRKNALKFNLLNGVSFPLQDMDDSSDHIDEASLSTKLSKTCSSFPCSSIPQIV